MIKTNYGNIILLKEETYNFFRENYGFDNWISTIKKDLPNVSVGIVQLELEKNIFDVGLATYKDLDQLKDLLPEKMNNLQFFTFIDDEQKNLKEKRRFFEKPYNQFNLISNLPINAIEDLKKISIKNYDLVQKTYVENKKLFVIGDVHEDVDALKELLKDVDNNEYTYCFNGDYLDKGNQTKEVLDFLYELYKTKNTIFVVGNHESFVYKRLLGQIKGIPNEADVFSSVAFLEKKENEDSKRKFFEIYENSVPFIKFKYGNHNGFITHAPCERKYLGKFDNESLKHQRNFYFKERGSDAMQNELAFMLDGAQLNDTIHVFGHVAHTMDIKQANNYWIDSGSVHGNKLTGLFIEKDIKIKQVNGNLLYNSNLFNFKKTNKPKF